MGTKVHKEQFELPLAAGIDLMVLKKKENA
jgi:hypothetical protein